METELAEVGGAGRLATRWLWQLWSTRWLLDCNLWGGGREREGGEGEREREREREGRGREKVEEK